ncbi:MAG: LacI family DNA-binding transcriptional regulator [Lachnospirales bacterium]
MIDISQITIKDIAKISGVGVSTVSRAINDHPNISPKTKTKVLQVMEEYGYTPNNNARNLKITDTKTIAVLIKGISNPFFSKMITTFEEEIQKKGYNFLLHKIDLLENEVDVAVELINEKKISGIIFLGGSFIHNQSVSKINVPFILSTIAITDSLQEEKHSFVSVDDEVESFKIVDYLCEMGHEKIAIIKASDNDTSIGHLRLSGYKKALEKNKIKFDENLCFTMKDDIDGYSMENGYRVMNEILESDFFEDITAVYGISDSIALGACRAIYEKGLSIPEDLSVVGFDGIEVSKFFIPKLTTIEQPVEDISKETTRILFKMINDEKYKSQKIFKGNLIKGESTKKCK